jgi:hypothetical protein
MARAASTSSRARLVAASRLRVTDVVAFARLISASVAITPIISTTPATKVSMSVNPRSPRRWAW